VGFDREPAGVCPPGGHQQLDQGQGTGLKRNRERLIQRGDVPPEHDLDPDLLVWEQREWVRLLLKSLPPAQREVLACMASMFTQQETAQRLGKTEAAVRQNLHAARKRLTKYLAQIDDEGNRRHDTGEEDR